MVFVSITIRVSRGNSDSNVRSLNWSLITSLLITGPAESPDDYLHARLTYS